METGIHYPLDIEAIPPHWKVGYVGDFAEEIQPGFASGKHNKEGTGVPHIRPFNIDREGKLDLSEIKSVAPDADRKRLHSGDVLFNNTNSPELVGKTAPILSAGDWGFSNHMTRVRFNANVAPLFGAYQLHFLWMTGYYLHNCVKHVNQASVSSKALARRVPFIAPPLDEQKRIVAEIEKQFSRLDEAVANLNRVKANLKRYKAAVLKAAVEGRLVETEADLARRERRSYESGADLLSRIQEARRVAWKGRGKYKAPQAANSSGLRNLPEGWVWASVESCSTKVRDGVHKKPNYVTRGIPFITVRNLTAGDGISFDSLNYITEDDHTEFCQRTNPERGDVLITKDGTLGVARLVDTDKPFSIFVSVALVKPVLPETAPYLLRAFQSPVVQQQMVPKGSGLQHIHLEDLRADCIPLPPVAEQRRIVAEVDRRLSLARGSEHEIDRQLVRAAALKRSILRAAFAPDGRQ